VTSITTVWIPEDKTPGMMDKIVGYMMMQQLPPRQIKIKTEQEYKEEK